MSTSDTPRTDEQTDHPHNMALENDMKEYRGETIISECVPADFARQLERELRSCEAALAAAQARVAELEKDRARLDWLMAHGAFLNHSRDGECCNVWFSYDPDDDSNGAVPVEGYPQKCYGDARDAIDAAMTPPNTLPHA